MSAASVADEVLVLLCERRRSLCRRKIMMLRMMMMITRTMAMPIPIAPLVSKPSPLVSIGTENDNINWSECINLTHLVQKTTIKGSHFGKFIQNQF